MQRPQYDKIHLLSKKREKKRQELNYYNGGNSFCLLTLQRMQGRQCSLLQKHMQFIQQKQNTAINYTIKHN